VLGAKWRLNAAIFLRAIYLLTTILPMTTAILSALHEEQAGVLAQLQSPQRTVHAGREFWQGSMHGKPVVLALSRIGKVAAATTATALIERFKVQRMVFTGVAGGLAAKVQVGDVVVGTQYMHHDLDVSPLFARYEVPGYGRSRFDADANLAAIILEAVPAMFQSAGSLKDIKMHAGLIASGDRFVSSAAEVQALRLALPDALCVEMEGAAVAQVCFDYGVPFAAVRTISDRADDTAHLDFAQFVREVAGPYAVRLVDALMRKL
jgi:adenosylhomocysteine nucleosidase